MIGATKIIKDFVENLDNDNIVYKRYDDEVIVATSKPFERIAFIDNNRDSKYAILDRYLDYYPASSNVPLETLKLTKFESYLIKKLIRHEDVIRYIIQCINENELEKVKDEIYEYENNVIKCERKIIYKRDNVKVIIRIYSLGTCDIDVYLYNYNIAHYSDVLPNGLSHLFEF